MAIVIESVSDSSQARRDLEALKKSVGNIEATTSKVTDGFNKMVTTMATITTITASFATYARMSDQLTNMTNRLRLVTSGQDELNEALENTRKIALATGSDLKGVTSLYTKIHAAGQRFNLTQQQSARFTESIAKSIQLSGSNATEASSAILQFGQALASNRLGGDELRSVFESAPKLASLIEEGIGKGAGTLRKLAEEGVLTFDVIYNAIGKQIANIDSSFKKLNITYGRAFTNLGTAFNIIVSNILDAFGQDGGLAEQLNNMALNLALWAVDLKRILLSIKSIFFSVFFSIQDFLGQFDFSFPLQKFFAQFEGVHEFIISFLTKVDAAFEWIFDRVIGNSWIPDLVNGVIEWFKKLSGEPVKLVQQFADLIDVEFSTATGIVAGFGAALLAGFLQFKGVLSTTLLALLKIPLILATIATFSFLKTGLVLDFDTSINAHLAMLQSFADKAGISLKTLSAIIATSLVGSFMAMNKGLLPSLATLTKILSFLGAVAAFGVLKVGVMYAFENSKDKSLAQVIGEGVTVVLLKFKTTFESVSNKLTSVFDNLLDRLAISFNDTKVGLKGKFSAAKASVSEAIDNNVLMRIFRKITNPNDDSRFNVYGATPDSKNGAKIPTLSDAIKSIFPENVPFHIGAVIAGVIISMIFAAFNAGPLRTSLLYVFAAAAASFVANLAGNGRLSDYFTDIARSFLNLISRGITGLFDGNVIKDPFGLLSTAAKIALFFEGGRAILKDIALGAITSPTKVATTANDFFSKSLLERRIAATQSKILGIETGDKLGTLQRGVEKSQQALNATMAQLVGQRTAAGSVLTESGIAEAIAKKDKILFDKTDTANRALFTNATLQTSVLKESKMQLKELPHVVSGLRDTKKVLNTELVALKTSMAENTRKMITGLSNTFAMGGGLIGGVAGFQKGTEVADRLVDATPLQRMLVVVGFSAIGQLIGASLGAVLVQALLLFFRGAFVTIMAAPFLSGAVVIAGALYAGYLLFEKLPGKWQEELSGFFGRSKLVEGAQKAKAEIDQRLEYRERLKKSLNDPELNADQLKTVRKEIKSQEKRVLGLEKGLETFLKKNEASFIERLPGQGGLSPGQQSKLDRLKREREGVPESRGLDIFKKAAAALPDFSGLKTNFYKPTTGGPALDQINQIKSDVNSVVLVGKNALEEGAAAVAEANSNTTKTMHALGDSAIRLTEVMDFPSDAEIKGAIAPAVAAGKTVTGFLENAGSFFKQNMGQLSEAASELQKTFKKSETGILSTVKQQGSVEEGLKTLKKSLEDVNVKVTDKTLKSLSTKDLEHLADALDRVNDFSAKAKKMQKGSFAEKAALDLVEEWKKNIKGIVGESSSAISTDALKGVGGGMAKAEKTSEVQLNLIDQFNIINEAFPKLEYTLEEFRNSTDDVRESIYNQAKDIYESSRKLDSTIIGTSGKRKTAKDANASKKQGNIEGEIQVQIYAARQAIERGRKDAFEAIQGEISKVRTGFKQLSQNLDNLGLTLREDVYNQLTDTQLGMISEIYQGAKDSVSALKNESTKGTGSANLRNEAQTVIAKKAKDIDQLLQSIGKTTYEKTRDALSRFNIFIQEQVTNVATDIEREALGSYTNAIVEAAKMLDSDDEKLRLAAASTIDNISGKIEEFIFKKANTVNDASRTIGLNYLNSLNTGVQGAFLAAMKGDDSMGGGILGTFAQRMADVITLSILEAFTKGLTDTFLGNQGILSSGARRFGEMFYSSFGAIVLKDQRYSDVFESSAKRLITPDFGKDVSFAKDTAAAIDNSVGALTDVTKEGIAMQGGFFARLGTTFMSGLTSLASGLGTLFNGLMGLFGGNPGGTGSILLNGLFGILGAAGGLGGGSSGGMSAGNLKAASAFKFFATGGMIYGPGSSMSDSVPIMASAGEYVINAKSVKKFKPLLDSINNGRIKKLAAGGLVGKGAVGPEAMASIANLSANQDNRNTQQFNMNVTGDISRQTRREILEMIPAIASGVNRHNRERGIRS